MNAIAWAFIIVWVITGHTVWAAAETPPSRLEIIPQLGHSQALSSIAITPDSRFLASGSVDATIKLWDLVTGRLVRTFEGHRSTVTSIVATPDGRHLITGSHDGTIKLWETASGRLLKSFGRHPLGVSSIASTLDGRHIISAGQAGDIAVWDAKTAELIGLYKGHSKPAFLTAMPDNRHFISGSWDRTIKLWEIATGKVVRIFEKPTGSVSSMAVVSDGKLLASGNSNDRVIRLWDIATGKVVHSFEGRSEAPPISVSPDGHHLFTASADGAVRRRNIETGKVTGVFGRFPGGVRWGAGSVAVSPDGRYMASGNNDGTVKVWELAGGEFVHHLDGRALFVNTVGVTSDGRHVISRSNDQSTVGKTVKLWDLETGGLVKTFGRRPNTPEAIAVTPQGDRIVAEDPDGSVTLRELETGKLVVRFEGLSGPVNSLNVSPDGRHLVSTQWRKPGHIWDMTTGRRTTGIEGGEEGYFTFTPDSRFLVGLQKRQVGLWDVSTGRLVRRFEGHSQWVSTALVTPDGGKLISADRSGAIRIWDATSGDLLLIFAETHAHAVTTLAVSPDGRHVVSGSHDSSVKLWEIASGRLLRTLDGHSDSVNSVALTRDGRFIVSGSVDGTVKLWPLDSDHAALTLIAGKSGNWMSVTRAGFFATSGEADRLLSVVDGLDAYGVDQFYQALYRPDLVEEVLKGDPDGRYANAAAELDLRKILDSGPAPHIEFDLKKTERHDESATVTVRIENRGGGIGRIEWAIGNVNQGIDRGGLGGAEKAMELSREIALTPGRNVVEVVAYNQANLIASRPARLVIDATGPSKGRRGVLHVLSVGIDRYAEKRLELQNAAADARAMADMLTVAGADVFDEVRAKLVLDAEVTQSGLNAVFDDIVRDMAPEDTFVFFLAGHGRTIEGRYYFIPQDFRYGGGRTVSANAISQDQWQEWFSRITARKSVLIYDTCESEAITAIARGTAEKAAAIDRLRHATGRSVIAAARSTEAAYEGLRGHGLLTYTMLDAMDKADVDDDGFIELQELANYASDTVPALSLEHYGVRQQPRYHITSNIPIGGRVAALDTVQIIPKTPTHVVIRSVDVAGLERGGETVTTLAPGAQVRVMEIQDGQATIARDGVKIGRVPQSALASLH